MSGGTRYGCPECCAIFRSGFARCPMDGSPLQELVDDPLCGSSFADRYVIETCVGEGGMGRVYRARHQRVSRQFAIKVLFGDCAAEPKMQDRFAREAEAASRLSHPNVISVVDFGETEQGLLYLVMDWVEGPELWQVLAREAPFSRDRAINLLRQLGEGLAHAHDKGLVHRDFKTENVILTREGEREVPKIVDFGIAVIGESVEQSRLTTEGMVLGTPAYMAPEQATGEAVDARTDLFALGVMTYEMLAGVLPFDGEGIDIARKNLAATPPPVAERVPGVEADPELEALALKLMEKRPEDRYQSAADVVREVEGLSEPRRASSKDEAAAGPPPLAGAEESGGDASNAAFEPTRASSELEEALRPPTARRSWAWIAAGAFALAGLAIAGVLFFGDRGGSARAELETPEAPGEAAPVASPAAEEVDPEEGAAPEADPDAAAEGAADPEEAEATAPEAKGLGARRGARDREREERETKPKQRAAKREAAAKREKREVEDEKAKGEKEGGDEGGREPVTADRLQSLYQSVGRSIEKLREERGDAAVERYQIRYMNIPFAGALRNESLRRETYRKLVSLRAAVRKELRQ